MAHDTMFHAFKGDMRPNAVSEQRADIVGLLTIKANIFEKAGTTSECQMNWIVEALEILLKIELARMDQGA